MRAAGAWELSGRSPALATVFINYSINSEAIDHRSSTIQHINPSAGVVSNGLLIRNHTTLTLAVEAQFQSAGRLTTPLIASQHNAEPWHGSWPLAPADPRRKHAVSHPQHNHLLMRCRNQPG